MYVFIGLYKQEVSYLQVELIKYKIKLGATKKLLLDINHLSLVFTICCETFIEFRKQYLI